MLQIYSDTNIGHSQRLKPRKPTRRLVQKLILERFDANTKWNDKSATLTN